MQVYVSFCNSYAGRIPTIMRIYCTCILGILLLLPDFNQGYTCLSCKAAVIPKYCDTIEHCGSHEECYVDEYATTIGSLRFNLGCRDTQHCLSGSGTHKRQTTNTLLSSRCCNGNLCNNATTNYAGYAQNRGPICFTCATQGHYDTCNKIKVCGEHEKCAIRSRSDHHGFFETGCERNTVCDAAILVGKRTEGRYKRDATCWECCNTDLCNDKCIHPGAQIDPCATHTKPCLHGMCFNKGTSYVCQCDPGWTGNHCESEKLADLCLSNPCSFGTCTNYGNYYACACQQGYTGVNCDKAVTVDHCWKKPCVNDTCANSASRPGYTCTCITGYIGQTCDLHCGKDIVFMIDRSIGTRVSGNTSKLITFLINLAKGMDIGPTYNLVGLTEYDIHPHVQWDLGTYNNKVDVLRAIQGLGVGHHFNHFLAPDADKAVQSIVNHALTPASGNRANHNDTVVIIATSNTAHIINVNVKTAKVLRQLSHDVIVISVGPAGPSSQVDNLATDSNHVFQISSYSGLDDTMTTNVLSLLKACA